MFCSVYESRNNTLKQHPQKGCHHSSDLRIRSRMLSSRLQPKTQGLANEGSMSALQVPTRRRTRPRCLCVLPQAVVYLSVVWGSTCMDLKELAEYRIHSRTFSSSAYFFSIHQLSVHSLLRLTWDPPTRSGSTPFSAHAPPPA